MLFSISSYPQKIKTVDGEYTYVVPESVDLEKAKIKRDFSVRP